MRQKNKTPKLTLTDRLLGFLYYRLPSDKFFLYILLTVFVFSGLYAIHNLNQSYIVSVPSTGGTLVEGVVGTPRFVNPVLAITRADHDLVALTYSGLLRLNPNGELDNNLAKNITISDDGLVYNVNLKNNHFFHDGVNVTANDVAFTISLIQDPELKSPLRGNWSGVTVEVLSDYELNFVLEDAYAPFIENLTVGIIPKHTWGDLSTEELPFSQYNIEPVGTGPYKVTDIKYSESGLIDEYILTAVPGEGSANIETVHIRFYQNESEVLKALEIGEISSTAALDTGLSSVDKQNVQLIEQALPRVFSVYFNQNKSGALRDTVVREALELVINRQSLVDEALHGFGTPTDSPIPPDFEAVATTSPKTLEVATNTLALAASILENGGWSKTASGTWEKRIERATTTLSITLKTANSPIFEATAKYLEKRWKALGIEVGVELYEQSDLVQAVIRPRDYEALLFGADVGRALDFYPFWHSAEREDPGLNVALYTNITVDRILENLRKEREAVEQQKLLDSFSSEITSETPAIFLYSPSFVYLLAKDISYTPIKKIAKPSERLSNIANWYIEENRVWPMFEENNN